MKLRSDLRYRSILVLAAVAMAGAVVAQQSPAPAAASAPPETQSFTVQPGTPPDEERITVIHTTTRRVVVDVVATDADGKPVPDRISPSSRTASRSRYAPSRFTTRRWIAARCRPLPPSCPAILL